MKRIILSILCVSSLMRADIPATEVDQEIETTLSLLTEEDRAWFALGEMLYRIIDDRMLDEGSEGVLDGLSRDEVLTLFGSVYKKKCKKCCNSCSSCSSCKKCKKCCCKVQSLLSQEA